MVVYRYHILIFYSFVDEHIGILVLGYGEQGSYNHEYVIVSFMLTPIPLGIVPDVVYLSYRGDFEDPLL